MYDFSNFINSIEFYIRSSDEIRQHSVCNVNISKLTGNNSVYDNRMGPIENGICPTCSGNNNTCSSHFGSLELKCRVIWPFAYKYTIQLLNLFCSNCLQPRISKKWIQENIKPYYPLKLKLTKSLHYLEKIMYCERCDMECTIFYEKEQIIYQKNGINKKLNKEVKIDDIYFFLQQLVDYESIGITQPPSNVITDVIPILPPACRPYMLSEKGTTDDDLTIQYIEMIKIINRGDDNMVEQLKMKLNIFMDNTTRKVKQPNGKPIKSVNDRLSGKKGRFRDNCMGKRVNFSARTVIGPNPLLQIGWIGFPRKFSEMLTRSYKSQ